jgi:ubiquinol oxidase
MKNKVDINHSETIEAAHHYKVETPKIEAHLNIAYTKKPINLSDKIARSIATILARSADLFFKKRYGHRAVVLETVAAVPGMVGGFLNHLKSLRLIKDDHGFIRTLINEAENERMHLIVYSHISKPTGFERLLIAFVQITFSGFYFFLYLFSPKTAHRVVGYFEEEAVHSYTVFLNLIESGEIKNVEAPQIAIDYWQLKDDATLKDVVIATRADEAEHRDVNHTFADKL